MLASNFVLISPFCDNVAVMHGQGLTSCRPPSHLKEDGGFKQGRGNVPEMRHSPARFTILLSELTNKRDLRAWSIFRDYRTLCH